MSRELAAPAIAPPEPALHAVPPQVEDDVDDRARRAVARQQALLPGAWRAVDRALLGLTHVVLFAVGATFTVLVSAEVVCRYLLGFSLFFVEAGARLLLVWFFLLGAGVALRHNAHVGFELVVARLHGARRRALLTVGSVCSLVFFLEMIWSGFYSLGPALAQTEAGLGISVAWFVAAIPAGFVLLTYHVLVLLAALWREPRSAEADESSATTSLT